MNTPAHSPFTLDREPLEHETDQIDPFTAAERSSVYSLIEHSIGDDLADKLIADFGGQRLYIPHAPALGDRVTTSVGLVGALALARAFGGDRLAVPVGNHHARRRVRILAMRADRVSIARIAHQLRCTERYVYKVLHDELPRRPRRRRRYPKLGLTPALSAERFKRGFITGRS